MKKNEFKCAFCGNIYKKGWSDEEAKKKSKDIWGNIPEEEQEIICDDCFNNRSMPEIKTMGREYKNLKDL